MKKLLATCLALVLCLSMVSMVSAEEAYDPFGRYDETVTITQGRDSANPAGEGYVLDDNCYTDAIFESMNIRLVNEWTLTGEELSNKKDLVMASNSMPDIMIVNSFNDVRKLYEMDMIQPLDEAFKYLSPMLKENYATAPAALEASSYDGKLLAIPNIALSGQNTMLWIRRDWLENLNLEAPTTVEEAMEIAKAFIEQDPDGNMENDTVGLGFNAYLLGRDNTLTTIDPFFGTYGAYPRAWLTREDGSVMYGSVAPEMKTAVEAICQYIKDGMIYVDPDPSNLGSLVQTGKCGMICGPWHSVWDILWGARNNDATCDFFPFAAPLNDEGKLTTALAAPCGQFLVVNKKCEHPEAVAKILNMQWEMYKHTDLAMQYYEGNQDDIPQNFNCWPINLQTERADILKINSDQFRAAVAADDPNLLPKADQNKFTFYKTWEEDPECATGPWAAVIARYFATYIAVEKYEGVTQPIYQLTPEMNEIYVTLAEYEQQTLHDIFAGVLTVDDFDKFVEQWYKMGGEELTQMINDYVK